MRPWFANIEDPSSPDLEEWIARITRMKWLFVFLGLLMASNALGKPPFWIWTIAGAVAFGGLGFFSIWHYERHRESVRALFSMSHGTLMSLGLLLPSLLEELARKYAKNYWLYRDYLYVYCAIFLVIFLYAGLTKRWRIKEAREQMEMLSACASKGTVSARDLFEIIMHGKGAKEAFRNWGPSRFAPIMGAIAVAFTGSVALGGGDGMLYLCFLLVLLVAPLLLGLAIRQRIELHRSLGSRDVAIQFLAPHSNPSFDPVNVGALSTSGMYRAQWRRFRRWNRLSIGIFLLNPLTLIFFDVNKWNKTFSVVCLVIWLISVTVVGIYATSFFRCPRCGRDFYGTHAILRRSCIHCGLRVYEGA